MGTPGFAILHHIESQPFGQVHNSVIKKKGFKHAIWKVPLIYGALGYATYTLIQNNQTQKSLKAEYLNRIDGNIVDPQWSIYDDQGVLFLYRQYLDQRQRHFERHL